MLTKSPLHLRPSPIALLRAGDVAHPERAVRRGDLARVRPGVYAAAAEWRALQPWDRYLTRVHAAAILRPDAVFSHESAAALLGMPLLGDPVTVHVLVTPAEAARESAGVRAHRATYMPDLVESGHLLTTTPGVTAVSLARARHPLVGLAGADAALRNDPALTRASLTDDNERRPSSRGRARARWPLSRATPLRESALESYSDGVREFLGFPAPELQHRFAAGVRRDRGDFWWPALGLLGEADGELKYDGRFGDPAQLLSERRERDRRLLGGDVRSIAHWGWIDVARVTPLRDLLQGHGLTPVTAPHAAALHSTMRLLAPHEHALSSRASAQRTSGRREYG